MVKYKNNFVWKEESMKILIAMLGICLKTEKVAYFRFPFVQEMIDAIILKQNELQQK